MSMLAVTEVAKLVGLSEWAVRRAIHDGELEAFKLRGRLRVKPAAVHDWLDASRVEPERRGPLSQPIPLTTSPSYPRARTARPWDRRSKAS